MTPREKGKTTFELFVYHQSSSLLLLSLVVVVVVVAAAAAAAAVVTAVVVVVVVYCFTFLELKWSRCRDFSILQHSLIPESHFHVLTAHTVIYTRRY